MDELYKKLKKITISEDGDICTPTLPTDIVCKRCNSRGHLSKDCPLKNIGSSYIPEKLSHQELFATIECSANFSHYLRPEEYSVTKMRDKLKTVPFEPLKSFGDADLDSRVQFNIERRLGYDYPTAIQKVAIPIIQMGRDVLARAQTGSGKTVAIMAPIVSALLKTTMGVSRSPKCVVISPTRELCRQLYVNIKALSYDTDLRTECIYGGTNTRQSMADMRGGCDIVVATPRRLRHFVKEGVISLSEVSYFIVDEADEIVQHMQPDLTSIVSKLPPSLNETTGEIRQTIMFSATFLNFEFNLFDKYLRKYNYVNVGLEKGASDTIEQRVLRVKQIDKLVYIERLINSFKARDLKMMVFVDTIVTCDKLNKYLQDNITDLVIDNIHSGSSQENRENTLSKYKVNTTNVLVCTDLASRGLDISGVEYIVQYDVASSIETYVHRIGRGGRCGNKGVSILFFDPVSDNFTERTGFSALSLEVLTVKNKHNMSRLIIQVLAECQQEVPKWLEDLAF